MPPKRSAKKDPATLPYPSTASHMPTDVVKPRGKRRARASEPFTTTSEVTEPPADDLYSAYPSSTYASGSQSAAGPSSSAPQQGMDDIDKAKLGGQYDDDPKAALGKGKKARKSLPSGEELRPARVRAKAPVAMMQRMERVMTQRMFLMDRENTSVGDVLSERFAVLGSTGNVYTVFIKSTPSCDCPDFRKGNNPCKHVIFVFLKVMKVSPSDSTWYQKGLTDTELREIFALAPPPANDHSHAAAHVRTAYLGAIGREGDTVITEEVVLDEEPKKGGRNEVGEDCPICFDEMTQDDADKKRMVYHEGHCGRALHSQCLQMWTASSIRDGRKATCVYCRGEWLPVGKTGSSGSTGGAGGPSYSSLGYMNLADVAGINRERDTSSYHMAHTSWGRARYQND